MKTLGEQLIQVIGESATDAVIFLVLVAITGILVRFQKKGVSLLRATSVALIGVMVFGSGFILQPIASELLFSSPYTFGIIYELEFDPLGALALWLAIGISGGLVPGAFFSLAYFITGFWKRPVVAAIFGVIVLVIYDLWSYAECSLVCSEWRLLEVQKNFSFSMLSNVVGGPIGGLACLFLINISGQVSDKGGGGRVFFNTVAGTAIAMIGCVAAYFVFLHPLPIKAALIVTDYDSASIQRAKTQDTRPWKEGSELELAARFADMRVPVAELEFSKVFDDRPITAQFRSQGDIEVSLFPLSACRSVEDVIKAVRKRKATKTTTIRNGHKLTVRGEFQSIEFAVTDATRETTIGIARDAVVHTSIKKVEGKKTRSFYVLGETKGEVELEEGDIVIFNALPVTFDFVDREGRMPHNAAEIAYPAIIIGDEHSRATFSVSPAGYNANCGVTSFEDATTRDETAAAVYQDAYIAMRIEHSHPDSRISIDVAYGWLTVPWSLGQLAPDGRRAELVFFGVDARSGTLTLGTERTVLEGEDTVRFAGDTVELMEQADGTLNLVGISRFVQLNGVRMNTTLWRSLDGEFKGVVLLALTALAGFIWRRRLVHLGRYLSGRSQ